MPSTAAISVSSSGDNTIVAAVTGKAIRVIGYVLSFSGSVNAQWWSGPSASGTALSGLLYGAAATEAQAAPTGPNARGWFQTASGSALVLNLSAGTAVGGHLVYELC